jgi:predicted dehydrogenase
MVDKVNLAILSCAHLHYRFWIGAIGRLPNAQLVAIWDDDIQRGQQVAAQVDADFEPDLGRLLACTDIDAVLIGSENSQHAELTRAAAEAGKHIACEKPMAPTLEECDHMIEAVRRAGVKYVQIFPMRYDPVNHKIKELIEGGTLGHISGVRKRHGHFYGLEWDQHKTDIWFTDPRLAGGGAFLDEGVHAADWFCWMFGPPLSVMASIDTAHTSFQVDDVGTAIYRFRGGITGTLHAGWIERAATNTTEIYGDAGTIIQRYTDGASARGIGETSMPLMVWTLASQGWELYDTPIHFPLNQEAHIKPFVECVAHDTAPPVTAEDGRRAVAMILAAYQSAREGRMIELGEGA